MFHASYLSLPQRYFKSMNIVLLYARLLSAYGEQHWWPAETPFEVIVGALLTQQTAWVNVEKAIFELKSHGLLSPRALANAPLPTLRKLILPTGYFNQKAPRLKELARFFAEYPGGLDGFFSQGLQAARQKLLSIPGVGPETADSILLYAGGKPVFVIDAYTARIAERLPLPVSSIKYAGLQRFFEKEIPRSVRVYKEFHALIVEHCKRVCKKKKPLCGSCCLRRACSFSKSI